MKRTLTTSPCWCGSVATPDGEFMAHYSENGLCALVWPGSKPGKSDALPPRQADWHHATRQAVVAVLHGKAPVRMPPLDLTAGTDFQRLVWSALRKIASGQTRSYGEIARAIGRPQAFRAVGAACGANPLPLLIPCHRVLAVGGKIGGFSGGLAWKGRLLQREGVSVAIPDSAR